MKKNFVMILLALCALTTARAEEKTVDCGSTVKITATAKEGYRFVKWSDESTENPRKFTNVTSQSDLPADLTAIFKKVYNISVTALEGGSVSTTAEGVNLAALEMLEGDEITVTAQADDCWEFLEWSDGVKSPTRTIVASDALSSLDIIAKFKLKTFNFKFSSEDDNKGTVTFSVVTE